MKRNELKNVVITKLKGMNLVDESYLENDNELDIALDISSSTLNDAENAYVTTKTLNVFFNEEEGTNVIKTSDEDDNGLEGVLTVIEIDDLPEKVYLTLTYDI